jgi:hypothetical protein
MILQTVVFTSPMGVNSSLDLEELHLLYIGPRTGTRPGASSR